MPKPEEIEVSLLTIRDVPKPEESLDGYLARLGELNLLEVIGAQMSGFLGLTVGDGPHDAAAIRRAAIATGVSAERLTEMQAHHSALTNSSDRQPEDTFGRAMVYRARRACPGCLRDHGYHKAAFEFRFVRICPEHKTQLLYECPGCGTGLTWQTPFLHRCGGKCKFDLRSVVQEPVPSILLEGQTYLLNAIQGVQQQEPPLLAGLSPSEVSYLFRHFGYFAHASRAGLPDDPFGRHIAAFELDGPDSIRNERSTDLYVSRFLSAGLRVLSEAPDVFEQGVAMAIGRAEKRAVYIAQTVRFDALGWAEKPLVAEILDRAVQALPEGQERLLSSHGSQGQMRERLSRGEVKALE
ncbi:TniQ family protein [Ferrovibrio xuzhouensis]|uniref:TniQ family protein n=1 Tax=Ferrovibrio xuzhouensis TaxID=1576914 RepID=A0ABV7VKH0_9PROT